MFLSSADCFQNYSFKKFLPTGNICMFLSHPDFFRNLLFLRKKKTGIPSESRVGSHVVFVRIHCTEKWRTSSHNDVLSNSK